MINNDVQEHFRWIGIIIDRIINVKNAENELPLLSLSFLSDNHDLSQFSNFTRPTFPIKIEDLTNAKLYGIIVSAISSNQKVNLNEKINDFDFDSILSNLSNEGYKPQKPCDSDGLKNGNIEHHVNLCKSIEFLVVDKSLNTDLFASDLRRLPRSFFVLKSDTKLDLLEDAISLWLSKFHCNVYFDQEISSSNNNDFKDNPFNLNEKIYNIQIDTSNFSKVAACLARIFPKQINKNEIKKGTNEEEIQANIKLSKIILDELHAFVIEKFPIDEHLFMLFISDLFYATRSGVKRFVKLDQPVLLQKIHSQPHPRVSLKDFDSNRPQTASALSIKKSLFIPEKETKIAQSPSLIKQPQSKAPQTKQGPKIIKPKVEQKPQKVVKEKVVPKSSEKNQPKPKKPKNSKEKVLPKSKASQENDNKNENLIESSEKVDPIEKKNEEEDLINEEQRNKNDNDKIKPKKYILEFPEIEILLKRLIQKNPPKEQYYRNIYDIFMRVMQKATIINSSKISEIFNVSKEAFNQLLDNQQELGYDLEERLLNLLANSVENSQKNESQNSTPPDSVGSNTNMPPLNNEGMATKSDNNNVNGVDMNGEKEGNVKGESDDKSEYFTGCDEINNKGESENHHDESSINNDHCDDDKNEFNNSNIDASNQEDENLSRICNLNKEDENLSRICNLNKEDDESLYKSHTFDDEKGKESDDYDTYKNGSNNSNYNNDGDVGCGNIDYDCDVSLNKSQSFDDEKRKESDDYNSYKNGGNNSNYNNDGDVGCGNIDYDCDDGSKFANDHKDFELDTESKQLSSIHICSNDDSRSIERNKSAVYDGYNDGIHNGNDKNISNQKVNRKKVTFILPNDLNGNSSSNANVQAYSEQSNKEDSGIADEMTDEMILREAEQISSQKFHSKLRQLTSDSHKIKTTSKRATTVPNYQTIINALRFNSLPGPKYTKLLDNIIELLKDFKDERILLLMASRTQKFKGIYLLSAEGTSAEKLWGKGPNEILNENVNIFFKYINGQKSFEIISTKSFTQTTDGFSLKKQFEDDTW